jgi:hypothetical protein
MADEKACERRQADRSALLERDRRGVQHKPELWCETTLRSRLLEGVKKFS